MIEELRLRIFYLSIKFDYILIEVVVFKVFGVDRLKGLVFDHAPILGGAIRKIRGLMLLFIQLFKIKVNF